jgi:hypothetical protein
MMILRYARQLLVMLAAVSAMVLGACHDDGLLNPPGDNNGDDSCCATLSVAVTSSRVNGPLAGVSVALRKGTDVVETKVTNDIGVATFFHVCDAEYNVRLTKDGYSVAERGDINITECDTTYLAIAMSATNNNEPPDTCCNSTLRIIPTDASGTPIAGAQVKLTGPNGVQRILESTHDGATFHELCQGHYGIRIAREGFKVSETEIELRCGVEITERRVLQHNEGDPGDSCCNGRLVVGARDAATGELLNGATVRLWRGGAILRTMIINGRAVVFEELCKGSYGISISKDGYHAAEGEVVVNCNSVLEFSRDLMRTDGGDCCDNVATIHVISGLNRTPITNAAVKLFRDGVIVATGRTNGDGVARFTDLCAGEYGFLAEAEGFTPEDGHVNVICRTGGEASVVLLPRNAPADTCCSAALALTVYDGASREQTPLNGVYVIIKSGDHTIAQGQTDVRGVYNKGNLCNYLSYVVVLEKSGYQRMVLELNIDQCNVVSRSVRLIPN